MLMNPTNLLGAAASAIVDMDSQCRLLKLVVVLSRCFYSYCHGALTGKLDSKQASSITHKWAFVIVAIAIIILHMAATSMVDIEARVLQHRFLAAVSGELRSMMVGSIVFHTVNLSKATELWLVDSQFMAIEATIRYTQAIIVASTMVTAEGTSLVAKLAVTKDTTTVAASAVGDKPVVAVYKKSIGRVCMLMPSKVRKYITTRLALACVQLGQIRDILPIHRVYGRRPDAHLPSRSVHHRFALKCRAWQDGQDPSG